MPAHLAPKNLRNPSSIETPKLIRNSENTVGDHGARHERQWIQTTHCKYRRNRDVLRANPRLVGNTNAGPTP